MAKTFTAHLCMASIRSYQRCLSPLLGPRCRFYPSCSAYALACLEQERFFYAIYKILKRLFKCNPLHPGGVDLP